MREVKFRARLLDGSEWIEFELLTHKISTEADDGVFYADGLALDAKTICQYTGLHDRRGMPIYEGDILQYINHPLTLAVFYNPWAAAFRCATKYMEPTKRSDGGSINKDLLNICEVVGDIYTTPELTQGEPTNAR